MKNSNKSAQLAGVINLMKIVNAVAPSYDSIKSEVAELRKWNRNLSRRELAELYGNRLRNKYTSVGVATSLPGAIPGFGTAAQVAIEAGTISGDLALMLRWMAAGCYGIGLIYEKDIRSEFNQEFVKILGIWCGVIKAAKDCTVKVATKATVSIINRNVSGKVLNKINQKVGFTLFTKYGTKRGGIALGKLIPFGVGAAISGAFNFSTMNGFKTSAINYFGGSPDEVYIVDES